MQCVYLGVGFICAVFMANGTSEVVFCRGTGQVIKCSYNSFVELALVASFANC